MTAPPREWPKRESFRLRNSAGLSARTCASSTPTCSAFPWALCHGLPVKWVSMAKADEVAKLAFTWAQKSFQAPASPASQCTANTATFGLSAAVQERQLRPGSSLWVMKPLMQNTTWRQVATSPLISCSWSCCTLLLCLVTFKVATALSTAMVQSVGCAGLAVGRIQAEIAPRAPPTATAANSETPINFCSCSLRCSRMCSMVKSKSCKRSDETRLRMASGEEEEEVSDVSSSRSWVEDNSLRRLRSRTREGISLPPHGELINASK
uniref:Uncharacterized protein n=1 Tax=Hyaloperonospora arabidopsidis (strain Emoy2) TaxID=559515 RepID=M4BYF0_HYAAE